MVKNWDGSFAACFDPRHGVRIGKGAETWNFVICYECQHIRGTYQKDEAKPITVSYGVVMATPILSKLLKDPALPTK